MARNYDVHVLTLAQVPPPLRVEGSWPGSVTLSAGWFRARARPWNESVTDPMVRLDRGGAEFLHSVTECLAGFGAMAVYSPAMYAGSARVWRRSGFDDHAVLDVMERPLNSSPATAGSDEVHIDPDPDWEEILEVDRFAFEGFWRMSRLGLREAHDTNRTRAMLVIPAGERLAGYAIVGSQWGTVYLHRIAVRPDHTGRGLGAALVGAAINWGNRTGSRSMVLNVRPENTRAKRLYGRLGFTDTGTALQVLRHRRGQLLN